MEMFAKNEEKSKIANKKTSKMNPKEYYHFNIYSSILASESVKWDLYKRIERQFYGWTMVHYYSCSPKNKIICDAIKQNESELEQNKFYMLLYVSCLDLDLVENPIKIDLTVPEIQVFWCCSPE